MPSLSDLQTPCTPNFCPGCGDLSIWSAFKQAAVKANWDSHNTAIFAGVGCHGHMPNFVKITAFTGLHGRAVPVATGTKMANHKLNVFVFTGDGDSLGEGGNHYIHLCRRNHNVNIILHDNAIYGLTTGQTSPASPHGFKTKSTPEGNKDEPIHPVTLAIAAGATFVARVYAGDIPKVSEMMIKANEHNGVSIIDILQPCQTFNKVYTHQFFQENTYWLGDDYNPQDKQAAFAKSLEWGEKQIPLGVIYEEKRPSYEDQLPQIKEQPIVTNPAHKRDVSAEFSKYI
jgi:2-oxoglutarate ferredoxin oxidoreductase subunit beta